MCSAVPAASGDDVADVEAASSCVASIRATTRRSRFQDLAA